MGVEADDVAKHKRLSRRLGEDDVVFLLGTCGVFVGKMDALPDDTNYRGLVLYVGHGRNE
jgi:hypothetical protein